MPSLTPIAQQVCEKRYFQKDKDGNIIEDWNQLVTRVVKHVCKNEDDSFQAAAYDLLYNTEYLPNSPCLVNAGTSTKSKGLLACFVTKSPEDCWSNPDGVGMIENIANFGHIARQGGGCGVDFSLIRPENDPVFGSTHAKACGPIEHMRMISEVMSSITQSGFRGMAMMSCLRVDHPDIKSFIVCKQHGRALKSLLKEDIFNHYEQLHNNLDDQTKILLDKFISNFNISVFATDDFMRRVEKSEDYDLVFNDKVYATVNARDVFNLIVESAWRNGDPGMLFYDTINEGPYKYSEQEITATNPCFQGDSLVAVADGRGFVSIKQLASEKKNVPVYCYNPQTGGIYIKWGRNPRKTRSNASLCKITFDDGGQITTTPDHKILLSNGKYVEVQNLSEGYSVKVMTKFQTAFTNGTYWTINKGKSLSAPKSSAKMQHALFEHRMIYEFYTENQLNSSDVIHHKDFDSTNNSIGNLQKMSFSEHSAYHRQFNNPMTHWYPNATPEERQKYHDTMSAATTGELNGMYGRKHSAVSKKKIGTKTIERCKDEEYKTKLMESIKDSWTDDKRNKQSDKKKTHWQEGKYDSLKSEITTKNCEWCGKEFSRKSFITEQLRFCSVECGNQIDISDSEIIANAISFTEQYGFYPSVSTWAIFDDAVCSGELIRTRFGNFQKLSEKLIDIGVFVKVTSNTKMTFKMIAASVVSWTTTHGREPSRTEITKDICSNQSLSRHGGYENIIASANKLCCENSVNHKVVSVEMLSETEDVFNITVDDFHNLCIFSSSKTKEVKRKGRRRNISTCYSIVYRNCGEQCLPQYGSCNLGSIDVSKFYNEDREIMEWTRLGSAIETSVQFLDDVIGINQFPTPDFAKWAKENRPVGLGIMGWADLLLKMKIAYGSDDSFKFAQKLGRFFEKTSHEKSVALGQERGTPKACRYDELEHRRNVTTLSIAPTGTISLLAGCSSSIEPVFSAVTYRYDNTGAKEMRHPYAKKSWFRSSSDLSWQEHVGMQAAWQPYINSAISKTINFTNQATEEDIANAYMTAWKSGCKGITVYRDGCKTTQVLNTRAKSVVGTNHAKPRPKEVEADIFKTIADGLEWHVIVGKVDDVPYEVFAVNGKQNLPDSAKVVKRKKRHYSLMTENNEILIDNLGVEEDEINPKIGLETRRFSMELRHGIDPKHIVTIIDKSSDVITSFTKAVGRIMKNKYISAEDLCEIASVPCFDCAKKGKIVQMIPEAGCWRCPSCHNSKCA